MYPGDPSGKAAEIVNCRCSLDDVPRWYVEKGGSQYRRNNITGEIINCKNYAEFKEKYLQITDTYSGHLKNNAKSDNMYTYTSTENINDALGYMEQFADTVEFKGVKNLGSINAINETLTELTQRFPTDKLLKINVDGRMSEFGVSNHQHLTFNKKFLNSPPTENVNFKEYCLNRLTEYQKAIDNYSEILKNETDKKRRRWYAKEINEYKYWIKKTEEMSKYSRYGVDESVAGVTRHEYGHIIAGQYSGLISATVPQETIEKHHTIYNANTLRRMWSETFQKAKDTGDIYEISAYASKNHKEFFAECFSMYSKGEKLPSYIVKNLERILNVG